MKEYTAADGTTFTDSDIDNWCDYYDNGEFPPGEKFSGKVVKGRPPMSSANQTTLTIKMPVGLKKAIKNKAKEKGVTTSALVREQLSKACM